MNKITKRIIVYIIGVFLLALGASISIKAELGVSPVSSLGYALSLVVGMSVGLGTFLSNIVFIFFQFIISGKFEFKNYVIQLMLAVVISLFIDLTIAMTNVLPDAETFWLKVVYLIISLFVIAAGVFLYFNTRLPVSPYDALLPIMRERFNITVAKAKIIGDMTNVTISAIICLVFLKKFGAIGIGTFVAAYFIGKILGAIMKRLRSPLLRYMELEEI